MSLQNKFFVRLKRTPISVAPIFLDFAAPAATFLALTAEWPFASSSPPPPYRRRSFVWHAGYMDANKAEELEQEIEVKQKLLDQARFHQCLGTAQQLASVKQQQDELLSLHAEYEKLTGEPYDPSNRNNKNDNREESFRAQVQSNSVQEK